MKRCPHCGNNLPDNAPVCNYCGAVWLQNDNTQYTPSNGARRNEATQISSPNGMPPNGPARFDFNGMPQPQPYRPQPPRDKSRVWLIALAIFLFLVVAALATFLLLGYSSKDTAKGQTGEDTSGYVDEKDDDSRDSSVPIVERKSPSDTKTGKAPVSTPSPKPAPAEKPPVANGYYNLSGVISHEENYYFNMQLNVAGNNVTGSYVVTNGANTTVRLSGRVDSSGKITLREYNHGRLTEYYFEGRFYGSTFSGKYKSTARRLMMNFTASPSY